MNTGSILLALVLALSLSGCASGPKTAKETRDDANLKQASATNVQLGVGYLRRGQYEIAKEKLQKAIDQDPKNIDAYTTMAFLLIQVDELEKVEEYYLAALDVKEKDPGLRNSYGAYLCRVGRTDDALEQFKLAYNSPYYKTAFLAYANAGTCLFQANRYEEAEVMLRKALKLQPELPDALISMAELALATESYMKSRAYIQRYHAGNKPSAESLWVQVQAERALGAKQHYYKYARHLLAEFPDSEQADLVEELARRDRIKQY
ncbi:MAG: type IV pilus biogenesis/stability protein PilW [Gammaproteobacteria bacterium]|jgi:type IV pilus assembly protein PilF|nr:type IV pilus biogenesis/stability protein PilW [Gammaproteobacteria bacterium]